MLIRQIKLQNLLSFGPTAKGLELGPLNVLIGPNGSGKSNLIEAIGLLQTAPKDLAASIREGGGIREWIWKGDQKVQGGSILNLKDTGQRRLRWEAIDPEQSILSQRKDPESYPEVTSPFKVATSF